MIEPGHSGLADRYPPNDLVYRVTGVYDQGWFHRSGSQSVNDIRSALNRVDRRLEEFQDILDFGCGCGRVLLWLSEFVDPERLHGVDVDQEAISWAQSHLPSVDLRVSGPLPPLEYEDESFDFIHCHSVLTHLNERYQDAWLAEFRRLAKPGAIMLVSTHGEHAFDKLESLWHEHGGDPAPLKQRWKQSGTLYLEDDEWKDGPFPDYYHSMFHTPWYVRRHWGKILHIRAHIPRGALEYQDLVVLERPEGFAGSIGLPEQPPLPPLELRRLVGPLEDVHYDNPGGGLVFPEVPTHCFDSVFDFGCGCGRIARQLLQQKYRPKRYVGIDIHRGMIDWCVEKLSSIDPNFRFLHHDVFNLGLAPENTQQPTAPFPVGDGEFTLVNAHSVFTHILKEQTEHYLRETARILHTDGVARTTWFFFDAESFPWLADGQVCLFVNELDPTNAVIYDRRWFLRAVRSAGMSVRLTIPPTVPGHQWQVFLDHARPDQPDWFPLGEAASEWLCGATRHALPSHFWRDE